MESVRLATYAMGTRFELVLCGPDGRHLRAAGDEAIDAIEDAHRRLTAFARDSVIGRINAMAGFGPVCVDAEILDLLLLCERVRDASQGAFNVAVGGLMERRGFRRSPSGRAGRDGARGGCGLAIDAKAGTVEVREDGASVDLGAVGKGFALDLAAECLRDGGVTSAFMHGGTSTAVGIGRRPDVAPWTLRLPAPAGGEPLDVPLEDVAISVSGDGYDRRGSGPGHVIDARTGESVRRRPAACLARSAALSDAWATALLASGSRPEGMPTEVTSIAWMDGGWRIEPNPAAAAKAARALAMSEDAL